MFFKLKYCKKKLKLIYIIKCKQEDIIELVVYCLNKEM